jgi:alkane 1-monooxygenase
MCNLEIKKMTSFKYLAAYTIPMATALALYFKGPFSFAALIYAFGIIPLLEIVLKEDARNDPKEIVVLKKVRKIYDYLLYVNLPIVYALVGWTALEFYHGALSAFETCGLVLSLGISLGTNGINVAHELGHRKNSVEKTLAKALLLPSFYMHFFIEHNWGHHTYAATKEDPATAQYQQSVYGFWISSVSRQYANAWKIQGKRNRENGWGFWSIYNDMMWYTILQLVYLVTIWFVFNINTALLMLTAGVVGFILLETVNYIEHYGLLRSKNDQGRYEAVRAIHSWNSNHIIGRIVLYELTRHSDHHYMASKKYQSLVCREEAPQMPFGYPTSMVISLFPPLWFKLMNPRVPEAMKALAKAR